MFFCLCLAFSLLNELSLDIRYKLLLYVIILYIIIVYTIICCFHLLLLSISLNSTVNYIEMDYTIANFIIGKTSKNFFFQNELTHSTF